MAGLVLGLCSVAVGAVLAWFGLLQFAIPHTFKLANRDQIWRDLLFVADSKTAIMNAYCSSGPPSGMLACIFRLACLLLLSCTLIIPVSSFTAAPFPKTGTSTKAVGAVMSSSALSAAARHVGKLSPATSCLLLCDIQERFSPLIYKTDTVVSTAQFLTSVGKALDVPVVATQQYTKAFGPTVPGCFADPADLEATPIFEKKLFSMLTPEVKDHLARPDMKDRTSYILFGIEAHVCVQQTCLDLLEMGHDVHVIVDGVSSQQPIDREVALQRMAGAGAFLTTAQSAAFMLMKSAEHPNFKAVSKLVIEHMKKPNEFNEIARK